MKDSFSIDTLLQSLFLVYLFYVKKHKRLIKRNLKG